MSNAGPAVSESNPLFDGRPRGGSGGVLRHVHTPDAHDAGQTAVVFSISPVP